MGAATATEDGTDDRHSAVRRQLLTPSQRKPRDTGCRTPGTNTMNRIDSLSERALELAQAVTDNAKDLIPRAGQLLDAGAKLGVLKTGARVAGTFVRRNPVLIAATVAGAGLLWYAAHRRAKRAQNGEDREAIEGSARRVEARRAPRRTTRTARKRTAAQSREQQPTT
jgi:hypothetical protein